MKKEINISFKITVLILTIAVTNATAQDLRLAGLTYNNYPQVALKDDADGFSISFQEFGGFIAVPKVLKNDNFIIVNGLSYGFVNNKIENTVLNQEATSTYHRISYSFSTIYRGIKDWVFMGRLSPTLVSDFDQPLSFEDLMVFGSLIGTWVVNDQTKIGGGIVYTSRLGRPLLLPMFQYSYKSNRHSFNAFLPIGIQYNYAFGNNKRLEAGFKIAPNGSNFNANQDHYTQVTVDKLNYVRVNMGPEVSYQISDMLRLELSSGLSARRMYTYYDQEGNAYDYDSKNGAYLSIGLSFAPQMDKKE